MSQIRMGSGYDEELVKNQFLNMSTTRDAMKNTLQGVITSSPGY